VDLSSMWVVPVFAAVVGLAVMGIVLMVRSWPRRAVLTQEEMADLAQTPMPILQKRAWWSLLVGLATLGTTSAIITTRGAAEYWDNDQLRLTVVGIFIGGLVLYVVLLLGPVWKGRQSGELDERDQHILGRAGITQSAVVLIALAAWVMSLTERFHDQGAVPVVYLYLIFGSIVIVNLIGESLGILLWYWTGGSRAES